MTEIIPAIIPQNLTDLTQKLELVKGLVDTAHIDLCETGFIPNQPLPFADVFDYEAHLMVKEPRSHIDDLVRAGFSRILVQVEVLSAESFADAIHEWRGSVEIAPSLELGTPLEAVGSFAHELTTLQLMGIAKIGAQGRPFDERVIPRIRALREKYPYLALSVDGGVSLKNVRLLADAGAMRLVVGSAIFGADNPRVAIEKFKQLG